MVDLELKRASQRKFYALHSEQVKDEVSKRRKRIRRWLQDFKSVLKCESCGEDRAECLDFHHIGDKDVSVSQAVARGWGKDRIIKEIEKCTVLCANCHRVAHAGVM